MSITVIQCSILAKIGHWITAVLHGFHALYVVTTKNVIGIILKKLKTA